MLIAQASLTAVHLWLALFMKSSHSVSQSAGASCHSIVPGAAGYTETRLGGPRPEKTDQRSAAERAIAAAAEIPDPEIDPKSPKRVKPKKVSWADDSLLQSVRLFSLVSLLLP